MSKLTPAQCRAARALIDWSQDDLARASGIARKTIANFEGEKRAAHDETLAALQEVLDKAGVELISENGGGPGVRLHKRVVRLHKQKRARK